MNYGDYTCVLNKERIIQMFFGKVYEIDYQDEYENLLSFEKILEKYREYAGLTVQNYKTDITDITMRVISVNQENGNSRMIPIWIFYGYYTDEIDSEVITTPHAVMINGLTGEEL